MDAYITQSELRKLLKANGKITVSKETFRDYIIRGKIPIATKVGVKNKSMFIYDDVVKALKKSGLGRPISTTKKLEAVANPKDNEDAMEYGETVVKELGGDVTLTDANIYKSIYQGKLEKIKYEKEKGLTISKEVVEAKAYIVARTIRDKIMTIPERLSNELATIDDAHTIKELLFKEFEKLLDGFSEESFYDK